MRIAVSIAAICVASIASASPITLKYETVACTSRDNLSRFVRIIRQDDRKAVEESIFTGQCVLLKAGDEVFVAGSERSGPVLIRRKGSLQELWTVREVLNE